MKAISILLLLFYSLASAAQYSDLYKSSIDRGQALVKTLDDDFEDKEKFGDKLTSAEILLLRKGKITNSSEVADYPKALLNKVLQQVRTDAKIELYVYNDVGVNAYSLPNGSIYVTLGLLWAIDNEEELAFILAHEVGHIVKSHGVISLLKEKSLSEQDEDSYAGIYQQLQFSKEQETEADVFALEKIMDCSFNPELAIQALKKISLDSNQYTDPKFEDLVKDWEYKADTSKINKKVKKKEKEFEGVIFDDRFSTHPSTKKRLQMLTELISKNKWEKESENIDINEFEAFKEVVFREAMKYGQIGGEYGYSLYHLIQNIQSDEQYEYSEELLIQQLYMICRYKEANSLTDVLSEENDGLKGSTYNTFIQKWLNMSVDLCKEYAYNYCSVLLEGDENNEELVFWKAMMSEMYFGQVASKPNFKTYAKQFPNGAYISSVNSRLKD
ncbi:MAG: M48 family metallopeptidase [Salibacteraceae bacterium]